MRKITLALVMIVTAAGALAQQKDFEGTITYTVNVQSKDKQLPDAYMRKVLGVGDNLVISLKHGNYKQTTGPGDVYYITKEKRIYFRFKKIDTLFYKEYSFDTSRVISIQKNDSVVTINNIPCKSVTLQTSKTRTRLVYAPSLHMDPQYDQDNTDGNFNVFVKETGGAIWLLLHMEYELAFVTDSCIRLEQKDIDDHVFDLPHLPVKKFELTSFLIPAVFEGKGDAWNKYLVKNVDWKLARKYLTIPKGEKSATQTVSLRFVISEQGIPGHIEVLNKKEVDPALMEEAIRVIRESPSWTPARLYGEKSIFIMLQDIKFEVKK